MTFLAVAVCVPAALVHSLVMCSSDGPVVPPRPERLPGRRYSRSEARSLVLEGMMELEEEQAERAYMLWWQGPYHVPFPHDEVPPGVPVVEYRWDSTDEWEEPWGRWDTTSIYELRTRAFSICEEQGFVVTEAQFEVAAALVDEWDGSLESLLDLARITVPDPEGLPFSL